MSAEQLSAPPTNGSEGEITVSEKLNAFFHSARNIDTLWNFFVAVHLAIFTGIFTLNSLNTVQLVVIGIAYVIFSFLNMRAKKYEYKIYNALIIDIKKNIEHEDNELAAFMREYEVNVKDRLYIAYGVHFCSFIFAGVLLFSSEINTFIRNLVA
jgi:hypothetical protein